MLQVFSGFGNPLPVPELACSQRSNSLANHADDDRHPTNRFYPPGTVGQTRHYSGPPPALAPSADARREFGAARAVLLQQEESGVFLYRFDEHGNLGGDTWHQSVEDAKHQASYEYGSGLGEWRAVPDEVTDARAYAVSLLATNLPRA